ncbi:MAG TPA: hypothetical protein DCG28_04460 [Lachnospiraceae bacterium]|nr:hypothetical protein [Lachnospiraceae bacterium]
MQRKTKNGVTVMDKLFLNTRKILKSRVTLVFVSFLLLCSILVSVLVIALESEHECSGDDCPICACIHQCEKCISLLSSGCVSFFAFANCNTLRTLLVKTAEKVFSHTTPITQKVRLND